jgi:hypothetical protein
VKPAAETQIAAVDVIMRQVKLSGGHRQRLAADRARITDPVPGNRQRPRATVRMIVGSDTRAPDPGRRDHNLIVPRALKKTGFPRCVRLKGCGVALTFCHATCDPSSLAVTIRGWAHAGAREACLAGGQRALVTVVTAGPLACHRLACRHSPVRRACPSLPSPDRAAHDRPELACLAGVPVGAVAVVGTGPVASWSWPADRARPHRAPGQRGHWPASPWSVYPASMSAWSSGLPHSAH